MSSNKPDPVAHMSDLVELKQELLLAMERQKSEILHWMVIQTAANAALTAAIVKLFG
ncbi:hypothetical protein [Pseudoduganella sp. R-34]|uniref:hypothetical protein n=1 Tax=unclassified Pseudoduganella TaxID=2637179 RepID=UPI003CF7ACBA